MTDNSGNSDARIGWGSTVKLANAQGVLTALDEVTNITLPESEVDDKEVTHFKSPGKAKEYKPGLSDAGTGTIELNYLPGSATDVLLHGAIGQVRAYEETVPDETGAPTWKVSGFLYVKSIARPVAVGDVMKQTVNVRFTGATTEAAVTA